MSIAINVADYTTNRGIHSRTCCKEKEQVLPDLFFLRQGQKDSNPRHAVLEVMSN